MSRSPFDALVDAYDAARPAYPEALYDALEPLAGRHVVDVGAGTGIATRAMQARGARVTAVDLGEEMLRRLSQRSRTPALTADAHRLPLRDATADLVTYAQAFHWLRPAEALAEASRVLRPDGRIAVWWNDVDAGDQAWWQAQQLRLEAANPAYHRDYRRIDDPLPGAQYHEIRWVRDIALDDYLVWLHSKSYVAALGPAEPDFLAAERASLGQAFPSGVVREPFRTRLWVAPRPR